MHVDYDSDVPHMPKFLWSHSVTLITLELKEQTAFKLHANRHEHELNFKSWHTSSWLERRCIPVVHNRCTASSNTLTTTKRKTIMFCGRRRVSCSVYITKTSSSTWNFKNWTPTITITRIIFVISIPNSDFLLNYIRLIHITYKHFKTHCRSKLNQPDFRFWDFIKLTARCFSVL